ncbi:hypothetical protein E1091_00210 [Micromonospora fluostatini]|uniref:Uncharacterized protein n=1 Tax=Micromonospora fluostatini TaxID=1629071 RepID=A0ABY2DMF3_9ACTN|nr:hypothetical protein E1091_00210 [Micromonospora fluostatini]
MPVVPLIPVRMRRLPTVGGLAVPWITLVTPDGRVRFGVVNARRQQAAILGRLCQICGQALEARIVLAMRAVDLRRHLAPEPGQHPECAGYSVRACPMLSGRLNQYRSNPAPVDPAVGTTVGDSERGRAGQPAEPWSLVWVSGYRATTDPENGLPAVLVLPWQVLRVRPIRQQES